MMKKIKTHRFSNTRWGRAHLPFFQKFEEYLKSYFDVECVEYNNDGNTFRGKITTLKTVGNLGREPFLSDVDCVIENLHTGELKVISFTEYFNNFVSYYAESKHCSKVLMTHFNWHNLYYWMKRGNAVSEMSKVKPWIFLPFQEYDVELYRQKRKEVKNYNEKMFWQGGGADTYRKCVRIIENEGYLQEIKPLSHSQYLESLSESKIAISYYQNLDRYRTPFDYPGEFCYRDVEYMSLGVPFIRIEYKDTTHEPWIPNYHYISIPRDVAHVTYEKEGEEGIAKLYIERYNEVINDKEFLEYISKNQKDWYDRNIASPNIEKLTFDLLELQKWIDEPYSDLYEVKNTEITYVEQKTEQVNDNIEFDNSYDAKIIQEFLKFLKSKNLIRVSELVSVHSEPAQEIVEDETKNKITGMMTYKGYSAQQHENALDVFNKFLREVRPARILEIGTAGGGFTLFLRNSLDSLGLENSQIKSFDVYECKWYDEIRKNNIEINVINMFDTTYQKLEIPELIEDFIKSDGTTIVLCDGGNKVSEFNLIAPLIKPGDFILAHDYVSDQENFKLNFHGKIWNWCEIEDRYISEISEKENLVQYNKEEFDQVVWVCKQKVNI